MVLCRAENFPLLADVLHGLHVVFNSDFALGLIFLSPARAFRHAKVPEAALDIGEHLLAPPSKLWATIAPDIGTSNFAVILSPYRPPG